MMTLPPSLPADLLLQQLTGRSLSAFFIYNLQTGQFDYLNPAFEDIWERSAEEVNEDLAALLTSVSAEDLPTLQKGYQRLLSKALREDVEFRIKIKGSREKWIHIMAYAILQGEERKWLAGFAEDISHVRENELVANKFATHKNAMLEMMSHDLGGPLGIALQLVKRLVQQSQQSGLIDIHQKATIIEETLDQTIHLIHEYLETEYVISSKTAFKIQQIELIGQLQAMLDGFNRMDAEGHKHYHLESSSPEVFVEADLTKILQVFTNLVSNANKFTHINGNITIRVLEQSQSLLISVIDDGIGIPASLQSVIFERFTPARRQGLRGEGTQGLGLSIVKRLVEMHKGKIWVESEENRGTTFYVEIPYHQS